MTLDGTLNAKLGELKQRGLYRVLRTLSGPQRSMVTLHGSDVLLFSSNNYLGLADDPALAQAAADAVVRFGCGSGASRLISGSMELHEELERSLAEFKGVDAALIFNSGYHANVGVISAVTGPGDTIFSDELNHASIVDGCRLSRAEIRIFRHRDMNHLEELLANTRPHGQRLIVTDTVFSMDGDVAPLADVVALARAYGAWVMVDEAHAVGVFGSRGAGIVAEMGLTDQVEIQMGTLSKALGSFGAYVAGSRALIEWLVNRARSFIFTTALPPAVLAAALAALEIVKNEPQRRDRLWRNTAAMKKGLTELGFALGNTDSPILPLLIGDAHRTMALSDALLRRGVFVSGIRPPTVAEGTARLRVALMATHTEDQLARALGAFEEAGEEVGAMPARARC